MRALRAVPWLLLSLMLAAAASGQTSDPQLAQNLKKLSIEELTQLDITTASRRLEPLAQVAAAVSVIRGEDIRRSGATNLAEALRLADGIAVARADAETWAITTRGFNISTANKLLVLIDGRTVYSPLFAGTFWSVQDVPLADVDRIEVIRGPGGAVWGANAVNGVVNIITKSASDTKGPQLVVGGGTEERAIVTAQYGAGGAGFDYRVYGKYRARDGLVLPGGADVDDPVHYGQAGFRIESRSRGRDAWLVQGDGYGGREGVIGQPPTDVNGANLMARWSRRFAPDSQFRVQTYVDHVYRRVYQQLRDVRNTFDADAQQEFTSGRHAVIAGAGFRVSRGDDQGNAAFHFDPQSIVTTVGSVFAQDDVALVPRRLSLILGAKFERNTYTGFEAQPNARVRWTPSPHQTIWGAVSRALRLPTRFDTDLRFTNPVTGAITLTGGRDFQSEKLVAFEAGYRSEVGSRLSIDLAAYTNDYDDLRSEEFPTGPGAPVRLDNLMNARTWGTELSGTALLASWWRIHPAVSYLHQAVRFDPGSRDLTKGVNEYNDPSVIWKLRSNVDLPGRVELDAFLRHVGELPHPIVPAYAELDARLGWWAKPSWEISLVGQNLLHAHHPEFQLAGPVREEFQRGAYVRVLWRY